MLQLWIVSTNHVCQENMITNVHHSQTMFKYLQRCSLHQSCHRHHIYNILSK
jgi:hypothetical protein